MNMISKLKWFHYYLVLAALGALFYLLKYDMFYIKFGFIGLTIYYLWKLIFCRGIKKVDGKIEFNLSLTAEIILMIGFLTVVPLIIYFLYTDMPIWYEWIFPIIYVFIFLLKAFEVISNSNDKIIIHENIIYWKDDGIEKNCHAVKCSTYFDESDSLSLAIGKNFGWFLEIIDDRKTIHILDLKTLNLNGHIDAIEKCLKNRGLMITNN